MTTLTRVLYLRNIFNNLHNLNPTNPTNLNPEQTSAEIWILHIVYSIFKFIIWAHYILITFLIYTETLVNFHFFTFFIIFRYFEDIFYFWKFHFFQKKSEKYFFKINILGSFWPKFDFFLIWPPKKIKKSFLSLGLLRQDSNPRPSVQQANTLPLSQTDYALASIIS